jgi:ABC-type glycerol-3-phosphate transport system substrate-binding protein
MDKWMYKIADTFNKGQNAIWLNVVAPASGQKDTDLLKQLKVQGTLDLINLPGRAGEMCKQQELLNLTPFLNKERNMLTGQEELFQSLISTECKGCLLPLALTPILVYAHPENLQDAGLPTTVTKWTWDEFVTWAVRLTVPGMNRWGVALSTQTWMLPLAQYGGSLENGPVDYIKQGLTMVYNLQSVYGAHTPPNRQLGYGMGSTKDFTDNKAAMAVLDTGLVRFISSGSATKAGWVVLPLPTPTLDMQVGLGNATDVIGIAADSNKTEAAWQVLKWLVSSAGAEALARAGLIPIYNLPAALPLLKPSYGENIGTALDRTFRPTLNRTGMNFTDMDNALTAYFTGTQDLDTTIQAIRTAAKMQ